MPLKIEVDLINIFPHLDCCRMVMALVYILVQVLDSLYGVAHLNIDVTVILLGKVAIIWHYPAIVQVSSSNSHTLPIITPKILRKSIVNDGCLSLKGPGKLVSANTSQVLIHLPEGSITGKFANALRTA